MLLLTPKNHFYSDYIAYYDNIFTEDELRFLSYHPSFIEAHTASIGDSDENLNYRRTNVGWLDFTDKNMHIWDKLLNLVTQANSEFFKANLTGFYEPMQLSEYSACFEGHYDWHVDYGYDPNLTPRKLSMVLMISDPQEYEGGDLQVKISDKNETLEMKKGRVWFFPSYILHRVTPVTKGVRKTGVLWVGGEPWK